MARYAIYLGLTALVAAAGAWVWLAQQEPASSPPAAATASPAVTPKPASAPPPAAVAQPVDPSFDVVRVGPDGRTVIAGRAAPGAEVTVRSADQAIGTATADKRGEWVLLPEAPLEPGTRELSLSASEAGAAPREAEATVVMVVPERADKADRAAPLAVLMPKEADGDSRVLQAPAPQGDVAAAKGLSLDAVDFDAKGLIRPSGKATPGAELRVYLDNRPLGTATADERGQWSLRSNDPASAGQHSLRVDQVGADGQVSSRLEVPFSRAAPSLAAAKPGQIVVQTGNSLWRIARLTYGAGHRYTVIYQANKDLVRDPNKIYPGQVLAVPASSKR